MLRLTTATEAESTSPSTISCPLQANTNPDSIEKRDSVERRDKQLRTIISFTCKYNGISFDHLDMILVLRSKHDEEMYSALMVALAVSISPMKSKLEDWCTTNYKVDVSIFNLNIEIAERYLEYNDIDKIIPKMFLALGLQLLHDHYIEDYVELVSHFDLPHKNLPSKPDVVKAVAVEEAVNFIRTSRTSVDFEDGFVEDA